jgi:tight adherence protein B
VVLILFLVFAAVFAIVALVILATSKPGASRQTQAALASALLVSGFARNEDIVDIRKEHRLSSILWLHNLLARMDVSYELRRLITQADLNWTPGKLMLYCAGLSVLAAYVINWRTHWAGFSIAVGAAIGSGPLLYVLMKRGRRIRLFQQKLPEALDLMVSALRAGHSLSGALGAAAREAPEPLGREFRICFEEQNFGIDLRTATENLLNRVPLPDLRIVNTAMLIHRESGGNIAEVLDKAGNVIRERFRLQQQIRVHTAQGRLTGFVLILLPVIVGSLLYFSNPAYIGLLFTRDLGHRMLLGAALLNLTGLLIIRAIINIKV